MSRQLRKLLLPERTATKPRQRFSICTLPVARPGFTPQEDGPTAPEPPVADPPFPEPPVAALSVAAPPVALPPTPVGRLTAPPLPPLVEGVLVEFAPP